MIVCGASADIAQFEPFEWPEHALVWVGVGCGFLDWVGLVPEDASEDARDEIARAYVRVVCDAPMDIELAASHRARGKGAVRYGHRARCACAYRPSRSLK